MGMYFSAMAVGQQPNHSGQLWLQNQIETTLKSKKDCINFTEKIIRILPVIWFITMTIIGYQNGATRFQRIVKPLKQIFFVFDMQNCITTIGETL